MSSWNYHSETRHRPLINIWLPASQITVSQIISSHFLPELARIVSEYYVDARLFLSLYQQVTESHFETWIRYLQIITGFCSCCCPKGDRGRVLWASTDVLNTEECNRKEMKELRASEIQTWEAAEELYLQAKQEGIPSYRRSTDHKPKYWFSPGQPVPGSVLEIEPSQCCGLMTPWDDIDVDERDGVHCLAALFTTMWKDRPKNHIETYLPFFNLLWKHQENWIAEVVFRVALEEQNKALAEWMLLRYDEDPTRFDQGSQKGDFDFQMFLERHDRPTLAMLRFALDYPTLYTNNLDVEEGGEPVTKQTCEAWWKLHSPRFL